MAAGKYQMWEEFYAAKLEESESARIPGQSSRFQSDERSIFLGQPRSRALALVSPDLEEYVATNLKERASVLKERRKAREERATAETDKTLQAPGNRRHRGRNGGKGGAVDEK